MVFHDLFIVEEAPAAIATVICVSSFIRFAKLSHHFRPVRSRPTFVPGLRPSICSVTEQPLLFRTSSTCITIVHFADPLPLIKGVIQAYHVLHSERVDLAVCYRPENLKVTAKKFNPCFFQIPNFMVSAIYHECGLRPFTHRFS